MAEVVGYLAAIIMGLSLGLIGGGGSILTVPILVYLFGIDALLATAYSLFVVGMTSAVGSVSHFRKGNVDLRTAIVFGIPSIIAVFSVRRFLMPQIPDILFRSGSFVLTKSLFVLLLFAMLMLIASYSMIKKHRKFVRRERKPLNYPVVLLEGLVVGGVTGLVGAGGGFLIIPALVLLAGLPMKQAVGTSLLIIAMKSLLGFLGDVGGEAEINYPFILLFSMIAMLGILFGSYLTRFIPNEKLKPVFGWFVLVMGCYIIIKEVLWQH